jgi:hypothetical protein
LAIGGFGAEEKLKISGMSGKAAEFGSVGGIVGKGIIES